jgi:hypothetical protein
MSWFTSLIRDPVGTITGGINNTIDAVKDIGDFAQDEILIPVVDAVEDTAKAIADDPVRSIAYIAAASGPWAVWAVPLVAAADTAEQGGDVGDVLEAAAKAYVVNQISPQVGSKAGSYVAGATGSTTAGAIAAGATSRATSAIVLGQDPVQAAITGGVQAGVNAAMAQVRQNIAIQDEGGSIVGDDPAAIGDTGAPAPVADPIPTAALAVVEAQLTATLTGKDITPEVMANAVLQATVTTKTVQQYLNRADYDPSDAQVAAITNGIIRTTSAAIKGGDITQAALMSIAEAGAKELLKTFDKEGRNVIDKVTGDYAETEKKAGEVDFIAGEYEAAVAQYNSVREEMIPRFDERARLKAEMEAAKQTFLNSPADNAVREANNNKYNNAIIAYNTYATELDKDYEERYTPLLEEYKTNADNLISQYNTANAEYTELADGLIQNADQLDEVLKPTYDATNKAFVEGMTGGDFDAEQYMELNGLEDAGETGEEVDPFYHWLTVGKEQALPVNKEQYDNEFSEAADNLVSNALEYAGLTTAHISKNQMKLIKDKIISDHAGDLSSLKNADVDAFGQFVGDQYITEQEIKSDILFSKEQDGKISSEALNNSTKQSIDYNKNNVTDEQIANNEAVLKFNHGTGLINWEDIGGLQIPKWSDKYGALTIKRRLPDGTVQIVNKDTGVVLDEELRITIHPTLANLKETNPEKYTEQVAKLGESAGEIINEAANNMPVYELAKNIFKMAAETETGQDVLNSDFVKNFSGIATQAGGELVQAANGMLVFAGINPESTPAGRWARDTIKLGGDMKTEEWQTASKEMFGNIDKAKGFTDTIMAAYGEFKNAPGMFMAEIIGKEVLQELPILVFSGGAGNITKAFAKEMGEDLAQKMANKAALSTALTLDAVEAGGGSAANAFQEAYNVAINSGMNETEAGKFAIEVAQKAGFTGIMTSFATNKLGGATFEKAIYGTKKTDGSLISKFNDFTKVTGTEAAQGGIEESAVQGVIELALHPLDPNRDVSGNMASSLTFGVLAGGGTSSSLYAGKQILDNSSDYVTNVLTNLNPEVNKVVKGYDGTQEGLIAAETQLSNLGLSDNILQTNVLNVMSPSDYQSSTDVFNAFKNVEGVYTPAIGEQDQFVGKTSDAEFNTTFDAYIDKGTVDRQEVLDAAAAENITLTEDQINQYIGQKNEVETITDAKIEFDPLGTTAPEAEDFFKAIGYNPTQEEVTQFTAPISEAEQQEAIGKFTDPLMTDRGEVEAYFSEVGYIPTEDDITQFIGQKEEIKQKIAIGEFVDPKMVSEVEAFEAFKTAGLEDVRPEDVQSLIGQYDQDSLTGKVEEALPGARYNVLDYNLGEQTKKVDALNELLTDQTAKTDAFSALLGTPATDTDTATGMYKTMADQQLDFNQQLNQQTQTIQDLNALINQQAADAAAQKAAEDEAAKVAAGKKAQRQRQVQSAQQIFSALQPQAVEVKEVPLAQIGNPYDFKSIFRDAGQEAFYQTPYRKGGQIDNINDRLLKLIGDS